jgi:hypothetical protein
MANYAFSRTYDISGQEVGWALLIVPDDFQITDQLPIPRSVDYYCASEEEALKKWPAITADFHRRAGSKGA